MDKKPINKYDSILAKFLHHYAKLYNQQADGLNAKVVIDREGGHYQLLNVGWLKDKYQFYIIFHFDIIDDKVWVQENRTDILVAQELVEQGIPKQNIVLGFQSPDVRALSGYAVA
ncbi:MAG: XisI protein [Bacteroidetes bacterium]|jgi:hypothetical protein|nr:XisI protein [Bacteroidota bacterium]